MTVTAATPHALPAVRARSRRPVVLWLTGGAVALLLFLPLAYLLVQVAQSGWTTVSHLLFRQLTLDLLWNTVRLSLAVTAACAVIGVAAAWCIERTNLPGRRIWAVLVVVPLAIPDFVTSYGWVSVAPSVQGFLGSLLVMTLALYPLVYLPVAAAFRGADPGQEEVALSLGLGRARTFWRVTLAQARTALLGGCVLVSLALLAEYGAFEILRYNTLTTEIFFESERVYNIPAASSLSLVLVLVCFLVLGADLAARGRGRVSRIGPQVARQRRPLRLGRATLPTLAGFTLLAGLALGVPIGVIIYWLVNPGHTTLPASTSLLSAALHTAGYAAAAGALATVLAIPVALLSVRHPRRSTMLLERSTFVVQALTGLVIALSLVFFAIRSVPYLYQSAPLLIVGYAILFFPLALVAVRTSVAQAPVQLEEVGRSLGQRPLAVLWRVVLPLVAPGLAAAFCLVFLSTVTELTLTLVMVPTGVQTLATEFWAYSTNISYGAAAPYAALMVAIAVIPSYVLGRWFDRLPSRASGAR
jgi:iron(III) transport system permease protein